MEDKNLMIVVISLRRSVVNKIQHSCYTHGERSAVVHTCYLLCY